MQGELPERVRCFSVAMHMVGPEVKSVEIRANSSLRGAATHGGYVNLQTTTDQIGLEHQYTVLN